MEKVIRDLRKLQKRLPNRRDVNVIERTILELTRSLPDRCMSASVHHTPAGKRLPRFLGSRRSVEQHASQEPHTGLSPYLTRRWPIPPNPPRHKLATPSELAFASQVFCAEMRRLLRAASPAPSGVSATCRYARKRPRQTPLSAKRIEFHCETNGISEYNLNCSWGLSLSVTDFNLAPETMKCKEDR